MLLVSIASLDCVIGIDQGQLIDPRIDRRRRGQVGQPPPRCRVELAYVPERELAQEVAESTALLRHLSPLGWEHINLTGDYTRHSTANMGTGKLRPLRPLFRP